MALLLYPTYRVDGALAAPSPEQCSEGLLEGVQQTVCEGGRPRRATRNVHPRVAHDDAEACCRRHLWQGQGYGVVPHSESSAERSTAACRFRVISRSGRRTYPRNTVSSTGPTTSRKKTASRASPIGVLPVLFRTSRHGTPNRTGITVQPTMSTQQEPTCDRHLTAEARPRPAECCCQWAVCGTDCRNHDRDHGRVGGQRYCSTTPDTPVWKTAWAPAATEHSSISTISRSMGLECEFTTWHWYRGRPFLVRRTAGSHTICRSATVTVRTGLP